MNKLIRLGQFFRILDSSNNLSISNLIVILMAVKIMTTPALSMADIAAALTSLLPYTVKKFKGKDL